MLAAERTSTGDGWRGLTWGGRAGRASVGQGLLDRGLGRPAGDGAVGQRRLHLVVTLGAMVVGAPVVPTSVAYSLQSADHAKLRAMADLVDPGLVVAEDALVRRGRGRRRRRCPARAARPAAAPALDEPRAADPTAEVDRRCAALHRRPASPRSCSPPGRPAHPKGVLNTHGMLAANQQQMRQVWPFLADEPPVLLDWLPWSHTFGGNHNLEHGADQRRHALDRRRPARAGADRPHAAQPAPTSGRPSTSTCPPGYAALLPAAGARPRAGARAFLDRLRLGFFAAAALPAAAVGPAGEAGARDHGGRCR